MPAAGTAHTSERWWCATAASPVATSTVRSARGTVAIGFIAARTRSDLAGGHAALGAARAARRTPHGAVLADDLVVGQRAGRGGELEAVADLDALDRLDAHQRAGEPRVEAAVPVHVRAEAGREAVHHDLDDTAERVAVLVRLVDPLDHQLRGVRVEAAHRVVVEAGDVVGGRDRARRGAARRRARRRGRPSGRPSPARGRPRRPGRARPGRRSRGRRRVRGRAGFVEAVLLHARPGRRGPGAGRVSAALRASASSSAGSTGSADITCSHLGHSVLPISIETGPPWVWPCRTPPVIRTSSCSNFIRAPRP